MSELALPPAGHRDLIHDAAWRAHHVVFGHLAQPRNARAIQPQIQVGVETRKRADLHRR
jgi:hypothetical protein